MTDPERSHQLTVIELGDAPEPWADAGFTVVDDTVTLGATTIHLTGLGGWFRGWRLDGVGDDIDSLGVSELGPAGVAGGSPTRTAAPGSTTSSC